VGRPLLSELLGQADHVGSKTTIFNRYSLLAHHPQHLAKEFN